MSSKRFVAIAALSTLALFSCEKENFTAQSQSVQGSERTIIHVDEDPQIPFAEATIKPCGYGLYVEIAYLGIPMNGSYQYEIRETGTNEIVDSGMISTGMSTNWVLSPCTEYDFEFWGSNASSNSTIQTIRTEGCDGNFDC